MKREHLYVERKHPLVWLSALCMLASAAMGAVLGMPHWGWWITAIIVYLLILLLSGKEMLYRTAVPVWMLCVICAMVNGSALAWIGSIVFGLCYTVTISSKVKKIWLLPLLLLGLGGCIYAENISSGLAILGILVLYPAIRVHNDGKWHPTWGDRIEGRRVRTAPAMEQITAYFMPNRNGANNLFSESVEIT